MALKIGPDMSLVEVFLQRRLLQICVGGNSFTEHALRLLQISVFPRQFKSKRTQGLWPRVTIC